ncbi:MAG TPA: hypothetical protein PKA98_23500, partial [Acidimicrobiales bacterium]|nr:hypothetical protein [Acidimicrobiales bacterium]
MNDRGTASLSDDPEETQEASRAELEALVAASVTTADAPRSMADEDTATTSAEALARLDTGLVVVTELGLGDPGGLLGAHRHLQRAVAVAFRGLDLHDASRRDAQDGHRDHPVLLVPYLGHADLLADDCLCRHDGSPSLPVRVFSRGRSARAGPAERRFSCAAGYRSTGRRRRRLRSTWRLQGARRDEYRKAVAHPPTRGDATSGRRDLRAARPQGGSAGGGAVVEVEVGGGAVVVVEKPSGLSTVPFDESEREALNERVRDLLFRAHRGPRA